MAATDEPAIPPTFIASDRPAARLSSRLTESLIEPALDAGRDVRPDRAVRRDGWTPDRIRIFLDALAECGVVEDAARAAGMTKTSAYNLRKRTAGRAFHVAWTAAEHLARRRVAGELMSRALHGCVEVIVRDGQVWGERHRFDNRLTMAVLTRLDQNVVARDEENKVARLVSEEWDQYLDIVCAGGEGAADFIADRIAADNWTPSPEARTLERCGNYARYGVGLPEEIPVEDLDPDEQESWTAEQQDRAERSGLLDRLAEEDEEDEEDEEEEGDDDEEDDGYDDDDEAYDDEDDELDDDFEGEEEQDEEADRGPAAAAAASTIAKAALHLSARDPASDALAEGEPAGTASSSPPADPAAAPAFDHYPGWVATD